MFWTKMSLNRKNERTTQQQLQYYKQFCKKHPALQSGKIDPKAPGAIQELWSELAEKLNAMRGATRTAEKWKSNINQWKHQLRCRARKSKAHQSTTGVEPPAEEFYSSETFGNAAIVKQENDTLDFENDCTVHQENTTEKNNRKHERTTQQQLQCYQQFCRKHPILQSGKINSKASLEVQELWSELAEKLNAMRGATRTPEKWRSSFNQWKHQLRCRARKSKAHKHATGGEPLAEELYLTEMEQEAFTTLGPDSIDKNENIFTLGFENDCTVNPENTTEKFAADTAAETDSSNTHEMDTELINASKKRRLSVIFEELNNSIIERNKLQEQTLRLQERMLQQQQETNENIKQMSEAILALAQAIQKKQT